MDWSDSVLGTEEEDRVVGFLISSSLHSKVAVSGHLIVQQREGGN